MKGYQYLENDFFALCRTRKIIRIPMLLYIYLRGLYCYYCKPIFFKHDKTIEQELGLNHKALQRARHVLQERGLITFISGIGRRATIYQMLGAVLLPERVDKTTTQSGHAKHRESRHNVHTNIRVSKRVNKRVDRKLTPKEKEAIKAIKKRYGFNLQSI